MPEQVNAYIFLNIIKRHIDKIIVEDDINSNDYPFVDIYNIAKNIGIIIIPVPAKVIDNKHAILKKIGEKTVIFINMNDSDEEQRFSIAHEIAHIILLKKNLPSVVNYLSSSDEDMPTKTRLLVDHELESIKEQYSINNESAAEKELNIVYNMIAQIASDIIGKKVSEKTAHAVYDKVLEAYSMIYLKTIDNNEIKKIIYEAIEETIEEEIADYFAANLLVPTERFLLWEDKSPEEIARAFKVNVGCIKKRKEQEIANELDFLIPKNLSSDVKLEKKPPLSLDELEHLLGGSASVGQA